MNMEQTALQQRLQFLGNELADKLVSQGQVMTFPADTVILREGQYVKLIPIVLSGLLKVITRYEDKELLLYYIEPDESCIMSFSASLKNEPSRVVAVTEEETTVLLLPAPEVGAWVNQYPGMNRLFYQQYNLRYAELLETINQLLFGRMDHRLMNYLQEKSRLKGDKFLNLRHKQIAAELGTAREVVTRVLKRLEQEGKLKQIPGGIEIQ